MKKKYLFWALLFTLTAQIQPELFSMAPQEMNIIKNNKVGEGSFDYTNKKLSEILAEASVDKKNGLKIMTMVKELKDYLLQLNLNDTVIELIHYTTETLNSIKKSFLEQQKNRATVIKLFDTTIKTLHAKLNSTCSKDNRSNNNNNNISTHIKHSQKRKLNQLTPTHNSTENSILLEKLYPSPVKKLRVEDDKNEDENSKKRKLSRFLDKTSNTAENYDRFDALETDHLPCFKKSCLEPNLDINETQSPLSRKLWGNSPLNKRNEICREIDRYRTCLELVGVTSDRDRATIAIDEKMPTTPLIACLKLRNLEDVCMLIDAGVDCSMQDKNGEIPIAVALKSFMNWNEELGLVAFKIINKIEITRSVAEKAIEVILTQWHHSGEYYLSPKCPHVSRIIFFSILAKMDKNNIRFRNTDLIYKAIETNGHACIEHIIKRFDADVDFNGLTRRIGNDDKKLLFYMIQEELTYMIKPLIKSGKFCLDIEDGNGDFPITYFLENLPAIRRCTSDQVLNEAIDLLIDKTVINKKDRSGNTLFHKMVLHIDHLSNYFKDWDKLFHKLIALGADFNIQNNNGETPLHALNFNVKTDEKLKDKKFRSRFINILTILCEKTDDRLGDIFGKSAKTVKCSLWTKIFFQGNDYQTYEKQQQLDKSHFEILDN